MPPNYNQPILLVEDNAADIEITVRALKRGQVPNELVIARDGVEAMIILRASLNPGLILLDLNLPRMNGHEVLREIRTDPALRRIPVIMLTASTREEDIVRSYDLGANTFISKPVTFEEFIRVVASISDYWTVTATLPPPPVRARQTFQTQEATND